MEEPTSVKRGGERQGGMPRGVIAAIVVVVLIAGVAAAWVLLAPPTPGRQTIVIDGSSTVFPVTAAWAEELNKLDPNVQYVVRFSGTGAGFEKFCRGETDLQDASRPIAADELEACRANGIEPVEFQVAFDGLSVVVNKGNTFATSLTVQQLCRIWADTSAADGCGGAGPRVTRWNELNAAWPDEAIVLYGPGTDSGTFDYFVEVILDPFDESIIGTDEFFPSEDDNFLVEGVANDPYALGYFGYAYAIENVDQLTILAIDDEDPTNGDGPILPTPETIESGLYAPLSRPIFVYADANEGLQNPVVVAFLRYGLSSEGQGLVNEVGYVALDDEILQAQLAKLP